MGEHCRFTLVHRDPGPSVMTPGPARPRGPIARGNRFDLSSTKCTRLLERHCIDWRSIDVLRIAYDDVADADAPIVLLISVEPASLSPQLGHMIATQCQMMLVQHHLPDVECEIKESSRLVRLTNPKNI
ncbi:hypothetical protein G6O67_000865 [Ophiocordyceps sinensis]|uniref:Uncharacterized protein n=1 Tax=Ophiocordyceps sinensis TaxID=72228 RepID=A0A8H4Q037_9HYPO|nr:hypothetical protein G6O67_000865 [Ophiocordyceps sinensis]